MLYCSTIPLLTMARQNDRFLGLVRSVGRASQVAEKSLNTVSILQILRRKASS